MSKPSFLEALTQGYALKSTGLSFGAALHEGTCYSQQPIQVPLSMINRHGLIAGATGSGKTKTVQLFAENLSLAGVPVLLMDLKGDLSGLAAKGETHPKIQQRHETLNQPFTPQSFPTEFLSLSEDTGVRLRATVSEFGPILLSQILGANETQASVLAVIFQYCDKEKLPLVDLKDLKQTINYLKNERSQSFDDNYGKFSPQSASTLLRKIIELEQQGANDFFGEPSFEVQDLCRVNEKGQGIVSILRLTKIQDKPKLFSTFMLCLLAEIYATFEEVGDLEKPKLVLFIDEAHLIFQYASSALIQQLESMIKLIRSKGIGVYFCTKSSRDIPNAILGQLGLKVQHALRAFTAKDRKELKLVAENFPDSDFYDTETLLTSMGVGEALFTGLDEKGSPSPLTHVLLRAPFSRMGPLTQEELLAHQSTLSLKYATTLDRESAFELLQKKIQQQTKNPEPSTQKKPPTHKGVSLTETMAKQAGRMLVRELTRSLLGVLGINKRRK